MWEVKVHAHGQIALLAIVAAVMSSVPVGDASISAANKEVEKQMQALQEERNQDVHSNTFPCFADLPVTLSLLFSL